MTLRGPGLAYGQWSAVKMKKNFITATEFERAVSHLIGFTEFRQVKTEEWPFWVLQFRIQTPCSGRRWYNYIVQRVSSPYGDGEVKVVVHMGHPGRELSDEPLHRVCERCTDWARNHARYQLHLM